MKLTVSNASSNDAEIMAPSSVISSSITKPLLDNLKKVQINKILFFTWVVIIVTIIVMEIGHLRELSMTEVQES